MEAASVQPSLLQWGGCTVAPGTVVQFSGLESRSSPISLSLNHNEQPCVLGQSPFTMTVTGPFPVLLCPFAWVRFRMVLDWVSCIPKQLRLPFIVKDNSDLLCLKRPLPRCLNYRLVPP